MKIAVDISPIRIGHYLQHRVRGTGFYINNLKRSFQKYFQNNTYLYFTRGEVLPQDVDVVHYPYFEPFFLTLPFSSSYKSVVTVHDLTPLVFSDNFPSGLRGKFKWFLQKKALQRADVIIADSESSKKDIIKHASIAPQKISVVYLAAGEEYVVVPDRKKIKEYIHKKYNLPEKFALYVGDITWNKNVPRIVNAIKNVSIPLVMVGDSLVNKDYDRSNSWNKDLEIVQTSIEGVKLFIRLGFIPTDDLVKIYNLATLFIMPSLYEGFGLPVLEAMASGCPVVTSQEGSIPEIASKAVMAVNAYSVDSIAEGIKKVYKSTSLQEELRVKGIEQSKKFSWKITAQNTIASYGR